MLTDLLARHATEQPGGAAVVADGRTLTWHELKEHVDRLAGSLFARGVEAGDPVALLLPNCPSFVVAFLALARVGAVAIPLSPQSKAGEVRSAVTASSCRTLLADDNYAPLCRDLLRAGFLRRAFVRTGGEPDLPSLGSMIAAGTEHPAMPLPFGDADLVEQLTSGTTGPPKRIVRTHAHLVNEAAAFASTVKTSCDDRILATVPLSHAHGLGNCLLAALHAGATLVLQEAFDRRAILRVLTQQRISLFPAVPFMLSILADTRTRDPVDLSALRLCFTAGSALRRETWDKARDRLGIRTRQLYGSTEAGAMTINLDEDAEASLESVGRPLDGVRVAILDESGVAVAPGAEGEVAVKSTAAAEQWIGPEGRAPLAGPGGWIRVGDLGRLDAAGRLTLGGRKALVINVAGRKVNPAEIEAILMDHPKVREAVVVGVLDSYGEEAVKAVVVSRATCTPDELRAHCRKHVADFKVPKVVEFRDAIPRCPAGKVLPPPTSGGSMRILIVQPATNPNVWGGDAIFVLEPLWAEYLGAALEPEHDVELLDLRMGGSLAETQAAFEPDLIAMTAYTVDVNSVKRLFREAKARDPKVRTVVGGYHANLTADGFATPEIDLVILGEGVFTLVEVARALEQGRPVNDIQGVAVPMGDGLQRAKPRPWPHLDEFPFPDRSLTAGDRHRYFDKWMKPMASIRGSYGCPYRCEFCILWPPLGGKYLSRSPESFVDELATIEEDTVFFTDDEALIQPNRMDEVARLIEARGIEKQYYFMTRSDSIRNHRATFERWASIGLSRVLIGLESHRPADLSDYHKQTTIEDNDEAMAICGKNGVEIQAMFVLHPDYEPEDFEALRKYVSDRELDTPVYCILTPYPGTESHARYEDRIVVDDYDYWDLLHAVIPTKMPAREFYAEYAKLWGTLPALQRGILAHRDALPAEETLANLRKMRRGIRQTAPE